MHRRRGCFIAGVPLIYVFVVLNDTSFLLLSLAYSLCFFCSLNGTIFVLKYNASEKLWKRAKIPTYNNVSLRMCNKI